MSLTKATLAMVLGAPINLQDYCVGDGTTNDTAGFNLALAACPVGGVLWGKGLTYKVTGVTIPRQMTVVGVNLLLVDLGVVTASRDAFTVAAHGVQFKNCGATIEAANLTATTNAAGIYSSGYNNIVVDGGVWDGSRNGSYTPGNYRANIYIENGADCVIKNVQALNSFGEQIWMTNCTRPQMLNNLSTDSGGSGLLCTETVQHGLVFGNSVIGGLGSNSGMAVGGVNLTVAFNYVKSATSNGISHGEGASVGGLICNNVIELAATTAGIAFTASILVQGANNTVVKDNVVLASTLNTSYCAGIAFTNSPVSFECIDNTIQTPGGAGVYCLDSAGTASNCVVRGNNISSSWYYGIAVIGFSSITVTDNIVDKANRANSGVIHSIYVSNPITIPSLIDISRNKVTDSTNQAKSGAYLDSALSAATLFKCHENLFLSWTGEPYTAGRSCTYDIRANEYSMSPRSGVATLTNGGTTTVVNSSQLTAESVVMLAIGNSAAFTLNPKLWVAGLTLGSMTIWHTAGTAAGEQVKWSIL